MLFFRRTNQTKTSHLFQSQNSEWIVGRSKTETVEKIKKQLAMVLSSPYQLSTKRQILQALKFFFRLELSKTSTQEFSPEELQNAFKENLIKKPPVKSFWLYVLVCEDKKYYVGVTEQHPDQRFQNHIEGTVQSKSAKWCMKYKPIGFRYAPRKIESEKKASEEEFLETIRTMHLFGVDNVRGAQYCEINLKPQTRLEIQRHIDQFNFQCFNCHSPGHYSINCPKIRTCQKCSQRLPAFAERWWRFCGRCFRSHQRYERCLLFFLIIKRKNKKKTKCLQKLFFIFAMTVKNMLIFLLHSSTSPSGLNTALTQPI